MSFPAGAASVLHPKEGIMPDLSYIHPMIVHFPIALLIVGFLFEVIGVVLNKEFYSKAAFILLLLGTAGAVAAYVTGNLAGEGVTEMGSLKQALERHEDSAAATLWIIAGVAAVRIVMVVTKRFTGSLRWVAVALYCVGVFFIARTGHLGGNLVYKHAAGVQLQIGSGQSSDVE
jgi:uncharacterized membrane protein